MSCCHTRHIHAFVRHDLLHVGASRIADHRPTLHVLDWLAPRGSSVPRPQPPSTPTEIPRESPPWAARRHATEIGQEPESYRARLRPAERRGQRASIATERPQTLQESFDPIGARKHQIVVFGEPRDGLDQPTCQFDGSWISIAGCSKTSAPRSTNRDCRSNA